MTSSLALPLLQDMSTIRLEKTFLLIFLQSHLYSLVHIVDCSKIIKKEKNSVIYSSYT